MDCFSKIVSAKMYVSIDLEQPRTEQGIGSSETSFNFGGPWVYGTSNWSKCKCMWQCVITSKYQARLAGEYGEVIRSQWGVCLTGSDTAGRFGYWQDWRSKATAGETVGFGS